MYHLLLLDCPWQYGGKKYKPPYKCLSIEELKKLPLKHISHEDSILLIWTTSLMKGNAIELMKYYGFRYEQTLFVWAKTT